MAANKFARYIWLVDLLRRRERLTYEEINQEWQQSGLGFGDELPLRTFHNHVTAIEEMFGIIIDCDTRHGYKYYIFNIDQLEKDALRSWFIDSFAALNQIQLDVKLKRRIRFEDIPSGHQYLTRIIEAMRNNHTLWIDYKGFGKDFDNSFAIEPYAVKVFARRWYVIARSPYYSEKDGKDVILTYALDRITALSETDKKFKLPQDFDIDNYFDGCYGIINERKIPLERVVVKAWYPHCEYLETLPLHRSQKKIAEDDESRTFEYYLRPTFDLYQALLAQTDMIEVLEPITMRKELARFAENTLNHYKEKE